MRRLPSHHRTAKSKATVPDFQKDLRSLARIKGDIKQPFKRKLKLSIDRLCPLTRDRNMSQDVH